MSTQNLSKKEVIITSKTLKSWHTNLKIFRWYFIDPNSLALHFIWVIPYLQFKIRLSDVTNLKFISGNEERSQSGFIWIREAMRKITKKILETKTWRGTTKHLPVRWVELLSLKVRKSNKHLSNLQKVWSPLIRTAANLVPAGEFFFSLQTGSINFSVYRSWQVLRFLLFLTLRNYLQMQKTITKLMF